MSGDVVPMFTCKHSAYFGGINVACHIEKNQVFVETYGCFGRVEEGRDHIMAILKGIHSFPP